MNYEPWKRQRKEAMERTRENARRELAEYEREHPGSHDAWLNSGRRFKHGLRLAGPERAQAETLFRELKGDSDKKLHTVNKKVDDFCILCANLLHVERRRPVIMPLSPNDWTAKNRYRSAGQFIPRAVHMLKDKGLIDWRKGTEVVHRYTRIWPETEFLKRFPKQGNVHTHVEYVPPEFVVMRDTNGNDCDYKDTAETNRIRRILRTNYHVNEQVLIQAPIKANTLRTLNTALHAILDWELENVRENAHFCAITNTSGSKEKSGRTFSLITSRPWNWITLGFTPRMLYAWEGIQFEEDPYSLVHPAPALRPLLKELLLAFINSKNEKEAVSAGNNAIHEQCEKGDYRFYPLDEKFGKTVKELLAG